MSNMQLKIQCSALTSILSDRIKVLLFASFNLFLSDLCLFNPLQIQVLSLNKLMNPYSHAKFMA